MLRRVGPLSLLGLFLCLATGLILPPVLPAPLPHVPGGILCQLLADPHNKVSFIPPPGHLALRDAGVIGEAESGVVAIGDPTTNSVVVNVTYVNFTAQQQAAFQYAVDIWSSQVTSSVPVAIHATMEPLPSGVLGSAGATWLVQVNSTWHPIALANKLTGADQAPGYSDITTHFSTAFNWYYGTDGNAASGQYDFVSVVLHELGHGFGVSGSMESDGSLGTWGYSGYPGIPEIYDRFTENGSATALLTFTTPSAALHGQLTGQGGGVFWNGSNAVIANGGVRPRLYAPNSFVPGSSYSHLDETTYPAGSPNSLMTPMLAAREAIHDPGPITRGLLTDEGWTTSSGGNSSCSYSLSPTAASHGASSDTSGVSVITASGCAWTAVSNTPSMLAITSGDSGTGTGVITYSVSANAGRPRTGTLTIGDQTFTVSQGSSLPTLTAAPSPLGFAATNAGGGTLVATSAAQEVTLTQAGSGTVAWTATSNQPWLMVASLTGPAGTTVSGTGTGRFRVSVASSPVLPATGPVTGTITIAAPDAQSDAIVNVTLTLSAPAATSAPFGQVDTPAQNANGVQGAIGVTGWALDDVGVASVKIYRNCLSVDAGACQSIGGYSVVYIGDAAFVPGARADLETAFPFVPQNYRGGWGYLMLTNMLPNVTGNLPYGGQGPLTLYAFATDVEGNRTLLGRTWNASATPTTITMANATIAKPFGAIDTPGQRQTVSGTIPNFGWALTPDSDTLANGPDIVIPTNGSTMQVVIDGAAVATVAYNQCRGNVGNPVPGSVFCNDDVANAFGNPTPQAAFTSRTSNPTRFRNLDAGRAAIGAFDIDTTTLSNGPHSIAWGVTDSAGRAEGIGSRDFVVLNGSSLTGSDATEELQAAAVVNLGSSADLAGRARSATDVWGRTGFDFARSLELVAPDADGERRVTIPELGRLELWLGDGVTAGYLEANGQLRPLPPGSQLDPASGLFTWGPVAGYIGPYDLVFANSDGLIPVRVTLQPKASETAGLMRGYIDAPETRATVSGSFAVAGWALDLDAWQGSGVGAVHVWAQRLDSSAAPAQFLGTAELSIARPDVSAAFGPQFDRTGWHLTTFSLPAGRYEITAYFWSVRTGRFEDARTVIITVR